MCPGKLIGIPLSDCKLYEQNTTTVKHNNLQKLSTSTNSIYYLSTNNFDTLLKIVNTRHLMLKISVISKLKGMRMFLRLVSRFFSKTFKAKIDGKIL